jgi:alpha-beta hydrolase superfamily lysophospholipase
MEFSFTHASERLVLRARIWLWANQVHVHIACNLQITSLTLRRYLWNLLMQYMQHNAAQQKLVDNDPMGFPALVRANKITHSYYKYQASVSKSKPV